MRITIIIDTEDVKPKTEGVVSRRPILSPPLADQSFTDKERQRINEYILDTTGLVPRPGCFFRGMSGTQIHEYLESMGVGIKLAPRAECKTLIIEPN